MMTKRTYQMQQHMIFVRNIFFFIKTIILNIPSSERRRRSRLQASLADRNNISILQTKMLLLLRFLQR